MGRMSGGFESSATYLNKVSGDSDEKRDNRIADFFGYVFVGIILLFAIVGVGCSVMRMLGFKMVHHTKIPVIAEAVADPVKEDLTEEQKSNYERVEELIKKKDAEREKAAEDASKVDEK